MLCPLIKTLSDDNEYCQSQRCDCDNCELGKQLVKLSEYETLEEQGLLIELPAIDVFESSGDTVYYIYDYEIVECINCGVSLDCEGSGWITLACNEKIYPYREPNATFDTDPTDWCLNTTEVLIEEFGKTVFLTKERAEAALAEMEDK